jgi:hypothetical protein
MRKTKIFVLGLALFLVGAPQLGAQYYPYTQAHLLSLNDSTQYPCGNRGSATQQISASIAAIPTGGTVDLTCYQSPITITSDIFSSVTTPLAIILPPVKVTVNANTTIPATMTLIYNPGSVLAAGAGYVITNNSNAGMFPNGVQTQLQSTAAPTLAATTGGTLALTTYYYVITGVTSTGGETQAGAEASITLTGSNNAVNLSWAAITGAATYNIYRGTMASGENVYYSSATNSYTDSNAASTAAPPPVANTAWIAGGGGGGGGGAGACTSQVVTAVNAFAAPTCVTVDTTYTTGIAANDLSNLASPTAINDSTLTFAGPAGMTAGSGDITLTPGAGGSVVSPTGFTGRFFTSNATTNTSEYFTAGADGAVAPIANNIQIQGPASMTGHNRVLAGAAPSVPSFGQWSAGVNGAATFVPTPTVGGASFTQADVGALFTVTGCGATGTIATVSVGGAITAINVAAVNPGTSACSTGAGQAITGGTGNSATVNIATVLPVSTETFLDKTALGDIGATSVTLTGANAGFNAYGQGPDNCVAHQPANSVCKEAPTSVPTAYHETFVGSPSTGILHYTFATPLLTPSISAVADGDLTGQVGVAHGGTALATLTAHALYAGNATSAPSAIGPNASTTYPLFSAGNSADPAFRAIANPDLPPAETIVSSGAISTLVAPSGYVVCTTTCAVAIPTPPAAGYQFCVRNAPGSATVITLNALGSSKYYELTTHAAWATANQKLVSGGVDTDAVCIVGYDAAHYMTYSSTGTWTDTP